MHEARYPNTDLTVSAEKQPSCSRIWGSEVSKSKAKAKTPEPPPLPSLTPLRGAAFEKDVKRLKKAGKDMEKLRTVIDRLCSRGPLDPRHNDHPLRGQSLSA